MCESEQACRAHAECPNGQFCLTPRANPSAGGVCVSPCGKSSDCPANTICYESNERRGIRVCQTSAYMIRTYDDPARLIGPLPAGTRCERSRECQSGMCLGASTGNGTCVAACTTDSDCGSGTRCRPAGDQLYSDRHVLACIANALYPGATTPYPSACTASSASVMCSDDLELVFAGCRSSTSCGNVFLYGQVYPAVCVPQYPVVTVRGLPTSPTLMAGCAARQQAGSGAIAATCTMATMPPLPGCRSNMCINATRDGATTTPYCTETCTTDASCPTGYACQPVDFDNTRSSLLCVRR